MGMRNWIGTNRVEVIAQGDVRPLGNYMKAAFIAGVLAFGLSLFTSSAFAALRISVDKSAQTLTATRNGEILHTWPVSTGKSGYATPSGNFNAFRMEVDHYSKEWDDAPMPHSVFFTKQGHAIHGSYEVKRLGSPASHGCVRLAPENAAKLFALVKEEGLPNTQVVLTGSEQVALARMKAERTATSAATPSDRQPRPRARANEGRTRDARLRRPPISQLSRVEQYAGYASRRYQEPLHYGYSTQPYEFPRTASRYYVPAESYRPRHAPRVYGAPRPAPYEGRGLFFN